jgi:hypothetical protein
MKSARQAESDKGTMVRGMKWRRKERRKGAGGLERRFVGEDGRKRIMRKGLDVAHKRRMQERQRATGGPWWEAWDGGGKTDGKNMKGGGGGEKRFDMEDDGRKRIMRKGKDVGKYGGQNGSRETKENEKEREDEHKKRKKLYRIGSIEGEKAEKRKMKRRQNEEEG